MKKMRMLVLNVPVFLISISIYSQPPHDALLNLAKAVTKATHLSTRRHSREALLQEFKTISSSNQRTLSSLMTAYHHKNDTLLYELHADTLYDAINLFSKTPGFAQKIYELLYNANNPSFVKGHMYEVETALKLENRGEPVVQFGYRFFCNRTDSERTIDLVTESHLIECKDIFWGAYSNDHHQSTLKIQQQLLSYQTLAIEQDEDLPFVLHSKQEINNEWKQWLDENEIAYEEDN